MAHEVNILVLVKGAERYVYVYDDDGHADFLDSLRNQAASPDLTLSWFDVSVLTEKARHQVARTAPQA